MSGRTGSCALAGLALNSSFNGWSDCRAGEIRKLASVPRPAAADVLSFGNSIAVSGDVMIVGDPGSDTLAQNAGELFCYLRNDFGRARQERSR